MILADYEYQELGSFNQGYLDITQELLSESMIAYDNMFSDELFGYRKGKIEMMLDILYFNSYLYAIIQQISELEEDSRDNRIAILETMQWECVVKTLLCKGIKAGKYYNKILSL